jgi:hypothetical protein
MSFSVNLVRGYIRITETIQEMMKRKARMEAIQKASKSSAITAETTAIPNRAENSSFGSFNNNIYGYDFKCHNRDGATKEEDKGSSDWLLARRGSLHQQDAV